MRVLTFGYDSGIFARNVYENIGRLNTFAEQLLNHLADDPNRKNRDGVGFTNYLPLFDYLYLS